MVTIHVELDFERGHPAATKFAGGHSLPVIAGPNVRNTLLFVCLFVVVTNGRLFACLWDSETLAQEREKFPNILELITGKFLRHSSDYYQWRLEDRLEKLKANPTDDRLLDDVAVSYEKLQRFEEAIEIANEQLERTPNRYESLANLGTFLIHAGQHDEGLVYIDKALEVNPDAHFGREKYQKMLVEYILTLKQDGELKLPLARGVMTADSFPRFIAARSDQDAISDDQRDAAIKGVTGMMRFSKHDHPILLEVLGQLLLSSHDPEVDAKRMAARCFLIASYQVEDDEAKAGYQSHAKKALALQVAKSGSTKSISVLFVEKKLQAELKDASAWYDELAANEKRWIAEGAAVDQMYDKTYRSDPEVKTPQPQRRRRGIVPVLLTVGGIGSLAALLLVLCGPISKRSRKELLPE